MNPKPEKGGGKQTTEGVGQIEQEEEVEAPVELVRSESAQSVQFTLPARGFESIWFD